MRDDQGIVRVGRQAHEKLVKVILGILNQVRRVVEVIRGVEVEVYDVVPQRGQVVLAPAGFRTRTVRRPHVRRDEAEDVAERHLVLDHLVPPPR